MLQQNIKSRKNFSELTIKKYVYQIFRGLSHAHKKSKIPLWPPKLKGSSNIWDLEIAHRDLKPENVLISSEGVVKICDFGSSKYINEDGKNTPYIVSRYYRAPELILCVTKYSTAIDIWGISSHFSTHENAHFHWSATGCILSELYTKEPLFQGKTEGDQIFAMFKVIGTPSSEDLFELSKRVPYDPNIFSEFRSFPSGGTSASFRDRFKMSNDLENLLDLFSKIFLYLPEKRLTAEQAMSHPFFDEVRGKC